MTYEPPEPTMTMEFATELEREEFLALDQIVFNAGFDLEVLGPLLMARYLHLSKMMCVGTEEFHARLRQL